MKIRIIRIVVLIAVFFSSLFVISGIINKDSSNSVSAMGSCSLPVISTIYQDTQINRLFGYCSEMNPCYMRDTVTPLDVEGKLTIRIDTYGTPLLGISYEVRSLDTTRLIENSTVTEWPKDVRVIDMKLNIQDLLEEGREYSLIISLKTENQKQIRYYTRITKDVGLDTDKKLAFVKEIHAKSFDKNNGKDLVRYLESNSSGNNTDFNQVTIHSSYAQVTWGDLNVVKSEEPVIQIQEIGSQTGIFILKYQVSMPNDAGETERFQIEEYYRVRYTKERMYLLDYYRTMNQVFNEENAVFYSTSVQLGIANKDISFLSDEDGTSVCFVQAGELYSYSRTDNTVSKLFGFMDNNEDIREKYNEHDIKIIKVDKKGNTDFVVYGYMNRGRHEGTTGVSVCHFDRKTNSVEEYYFLPSTKPYQLLKEEVGQLSYIGKDHMLYIQLQGNIYEINEDTKKVKVLIPNIRKGTFAVSDDNRYLVWQKEQQEYDSKTLVLMDFDDGSRKEISAAEDERIKPLGYMKDDFIFGVAKAADIRNNEGAVTFPMYRVTIQNAKGEVQKQYEPSGFYVTGITITDNMIRLSRVTDNSRKADYVAAEEDQIVNSMEEKDNSVSVVSTVTEKKKREYQIDFGKKLKNGKPKRLYPKEVIKGKSNAVDIEDRQETDKYYYLYAKGSMMGRYQSALEAVSNAKENAGVVVTEDMSCIWERTYPVICPQINDVSTVSASDTVSSAQACLTALLGRSDVTANIEAELNQGIAPVNILENHLGRNHVVDMSGAELDQLFYSISKGNPVLAMTDSENYAIIVGYNELNTIVMNPQTGKTGYVGMNDSKNLFSSAGSHYWIITK